MLRESMVDSESLEFSNLIFPWLKLNDVMIIVAGLANLNNSAVSK